jgi:sec-independent protein translocase protein TatB
VLENLGGLELVVLVLIALFVFGPERLPKMIADASRMLRQARQMARNATADLREELGTDLDLEDLNPKTFVRKHLLSDEDQELIARPLRDAFGDIRGLGASVRTDMNSVAEDADAGSTRAGETADGRPSLRKAADQSVSEGQRAPFDSDAT